MTKEDEPVTNNCIESESCFDYDCSKAHMKEQSKELNFTSGSGNKLLGDKSDEFWSSNSKECPVQGCNLEQGSTPIATFDKFFNQVSLEDIGDTFKNRTGEFGVECLFRSSYDKKDLKLPATKIKFNFNGKYVPPPPEPVLEEKPKFNSAPMFDGDLETNIDIAVPGEKDKFEYTSPSV